MPWRPREPLMRCAGEPADLLGDVAVPSDAIAW